MLLHAAFELEVGWFEEASEYYLQEVFPKYALRWLSLFRRLMHRIVPKGTLGSHKGCNEEMPT